MISLLGTPLVSFAVTVIIMPRLISGLKEAKVGQVIQNEGPQHQSKSGTPTMGGLGIIVGLLVGIGWMIFTQNSHEFNLLRESLPIITAVLLLVISYGLLGAIDDWLTIRPRNGIRGIGSKPKFLLQLVLAVGFVAWLSISGNLNASLSIPTADTKGLSIDLGWFYYIFAVVFITGMANFVNITDGLDGLAAGLAAILAMALVLFALFQESLLFSGVALALFGACVGFLWFNCNPARIFMGDTGSLAVGALIPSVAIVCKVELLVIIAGLVFILDGLSSALQWAVFKYTRITTGEGKRVFRMSPVHHHFELCGVPEQQVVVRFWIVGVLCAFLAFTVLVVFNW